MNKISNLIIREATLKDINNIMYIQKNDGHDHSYYLNRARLKGLFNSGELFFIALLDRKPVGFASVYIEIRAKLHFLSVVKEKIGGGIGTSLLEKIISKSKKHKVKILYVYVEKDSMLDNFLIKKGFRNVGYFKNRFGKDRDANILSYGL